LAAANIQQLEPFLTKITPKQRQQLEASWPGPVTWLVPNNGLIPDWISGGSSSVALRVSDHPYVQQLCIAFGGPIVSTSANPQGKPAPRKRWQVYRYFAQSVLLSRIVKGAVGKRLEPSQIRDLVTGAVLR
jgi:L-threonylcarbamoyladenylate synthase